jgi:hypothetical protein
MRKVALAEPVNDLRTLGIQLQATLDSTTAKLAGIKSPALKLRAVRMVDNGRFLFNTMSHVVQTTDGLLSFLIRHLQVDINDVFAMTGYKKNARVTTHSAITLVNVGVRHVLNELSIVNREIDNEVYENDKK